MRLAVLGAGPIGIAAAISGKARGFDVTVFERGEVGQSLRRWGQTRFFSPLGMNLSAPMKALLDKAPPHDAILTGAEMATRILEPLAQKSGATVLTHSRVVKIGRARMGRGDYARHPIRAERPFRILVESREGERIYEFERVLDATGVYGQPLWLGAGGIPAPGERARKSIVRTLGDLEDRLAELVSQRILLVGHGHSAANALLRLADARSHAGHVTWAVRTGNLRPCEEVANDPLPERRRIVEHTNELAASPPAWLTVERRAHVERIAPHGDSGGASVELSGGRTLAVDEIVSLTGYRPDLEMLSELAIEISPTHEGAARLQAALANVSDCLSVPRLDARDLESGEPGFALAGAKSYGRSRTFLLKNGYGQLEILLDQMRAY